MIENAKCELDEISVVSCKRKPKTRVKPETRGRNTFSLREELEERSLTLKELSCIERRCCFEKL